MTLWRVLLVLGLTAALSGPVGAETQTPDRETGAVPDIDSLRRETRQRDAFALPDPQALVAARTVFAALVAGESPSSDALQEAGLVLRVGADYAAVVDRPEVPEGRGLYVVRETGLPLMFSAPHQFKDLRTGRIAALMTEEQGARAVAFNTAPRDLPVGGRGLVSDLGKLEGTHFNAFHLAFHAAHPKARIVQLHGFAREKRETAAGRAASVIVSNATRRPDRGAAAVVDCLKRGGFAARLYPDEVRELGGTTNVTFAALLDAGAPLGTFLHVEVSKEVRDSLSDNQDVRWVFGACLGAGE